MLIPHYSIFPPDYPGLIPAQSGLAGYGAAPDGQLCKPRDAPQPALLVFHDLVPLPADPAPLAAALAAEAARLDCRRLYADLERPPDPTSLALLQTLEQAGLELLIPECYAAYAPGQIVAVWTPAVGAFPEFLQCKADQYPKALWLELVPVCLQCALPGTEAPLPPSELAALLTSRDLTCHHSRALMCRYAVDLSANHSSVYLWDTPQTLREKETLAEQYGLQGVLSLQTEFDVIRTSGLP